MLALITVLAAGIAAIVHYKPRHQAAAKRSKASPRLPGVAVNLVACANTSSGVNCLAVFKGQCVLVGFKPDATVKGASPVDKKYCGLK